MSGRNCCILRPSCHDLLLVALLAGALLFFQVRLGCAAAGAEQAADRPVYELAFTADLGGGEAVYHSIYANGAWSEPARLSKEGLPVYHAAAASRGGGERCAVWTRTEPEGETLFTSFQHGGKWQQAQPVSSPVPDNRAATLLYDADGTLWLAWEGAAESYSDIYWSHWDGSGWQKPVRAHAANSVPDVGPRLTLDERGRMVLSWRTFDQGGYVQMELVLPAGDGPGRASKVKDGRGESSPFRPADLPRLPDYVGSKHKAKMFVKTGRGATVLPLQ